MIIISMRFEESILVTWSNGCSSSQIDHAVITKETIIPIRFVRATWTTIQTDHKMLIVGIAKKNNEPQTQKQIT